MPANKALFRTFILVTIVFALALTIPQKAAAPPIYPHQIYVPPPKVIPYDNETPVVSIVPPSEAGLQSHNLVLNFTVTKPLSWNNDNLTFANMTEYYGLVFNVTYVLDGQSEKTSLPTPDNWTSKEAMSFALNLTDLANGPHYVIVNASAWCLFVPSLYSLRFWNYVEGTSGMFNFTVNVPPEISVLSPENRVYNETSVPFTFTMSEAISASWFNLDNQGNQTVLGNVTLADLADGQHSLQVYAQVPEGSIGASELMNFTVDLPPSIKILLPVNQPYNGTDIPLSFVDDKPILWAVYCLDGQIYAPITGNTTLTDVSYGSHTLIIYSADLHGNLGQSAFVSFAKIPVVAPAPPPATVYDYLLSNEIFVVGATSAFVVCVAFCAVFFRKRRRDVFSERKQPHLKS